MCIEMNNVVLLSESVNLDDIKKDLTSEEYTQHLSSIQSMNTATLNELREQNENLIKLLETTHYAHDKYRSELIQLEEVVSDLQLDLEDERIESKQLREKLFSVSGGVDSLTSIDVWQEVSKERPKASGIYLLTDGIHQCVGYFNFDLGKFAKTTYFSTPSHWMARPSLPKVEAF
jgi:predicted nuclease with TOPRIM domain